MTTTNIQSGTNTTSKKPDAPQEPNAETQQAMIEARQLTKARFGHSGDQLKRDKKVSQPWPCIECDLQPLTEAFSGLHYGSINYPTAFIGITRQMEPYPHYQVRLTTFKSI